MFRFKKERVEKYTFLYEQLKIYLDAVNKLNITMKRKNRNTLLSTLQSMCEYNIYTATNKLYKEWCNQDIKNAKNYIPVDDTLPTFRIREEENAAPRTYVVYIIKGYISYKYLMREVNDLIDVC